MGRRRWIAMLVGVVAVATFVPPPAIGASRRAARSAPFGGTYRTAIEDFGFTDGFDPTGEYSFLAWGLDSQLLVRTLVTYRHVPGERGAEVVPDLATDLGQVSQDGMTYTFHLKPGLRFGPPVSRPITSRDIEYAFERIDASSLVAQYGFHYDGLIVGMHPHPGPPTPIPGIDTPDDRTIVFHLTHPAGDFLDRLALPAAGPIPSEVAHCFAHAGDYGRDLVSSGPYMIRGADGIDITSCSTIKPMEGFDPLRRLELVRNPDYDPSTDSPLDRHNFVDGVDIRVDPDTRDVYRRVEAGELSGSLLSPLPRGIARHYLRDPNLRPFLHSEPNDRTYYITMNLLAPPFDDVHVRIAVNLVLDKTAMLRAWRGPVFGTIATHPNPPAVIGGLGQAYDPYRTPGHRGDLDQARAEMKLSKYDHNGDGICDDPVCKGGTFINRNTLPQVGMTSEIVHRLYLLGIKLHPKLYDTGTAYTIIQTVKNLIPIAANPGWAKDYADPATFDLLFDSSGINCEGQVNYSEIGMTEQQAKECGVLPEWQAAPPPSIDAEIAACRRLAGEVRLECWTDVERLVMEKIVPWVPAIWTSNVTIVNDSVARYASDQFAGMVSLCHIALRR